VEFISILDKKKTKLFVPCACKCHIALCKSELVPEPETGSGSLCKYYVCMTKSGG